MAYSPSVHRTPTIRPVPICQPQSGESPHHVSKNGSECIAVQWLALTPPELVKAHLGVSDQTLAQIDTFTTERVVVAPSHPM